MVTAAVGREEDFPMSRKMCRLLTVVALLALTATAAAQAAGGSLPRAQTPAAAAWERIVGWFHSLPGLSQTGSGAGIGLKSATPPDAGNPPSTNGPSSDEGSQMDPNGR
jgi:hypothetical protein